MVDSVTLCVSEVSEKNNGKPFLWKIALPNMFLCMVKGRNWMLGCVAQNIHNKHPLTEFPEYQHGCPLGEGLQSKKTGMLVGKFEKNPEDAPRSCVVGVAWNFFHPIPILKQQIASFQNFSAQYFKRYRESSCCRLLNSGVSKTAFLTPILHESSVSRSPNFFPHPRQEPVRISSPLPARARPAGRGCHDVMSKPTYSQKQNAVNIL